MANLVSRRYAFALFDAGLELNKLKEFKSDMSKISDVLVNNVDFQKILSHPKVSKAEKKDMLNSAFSKLVSEEILNFLYILVDKRRESSILEISKEFKKLFNEHENIIEVTAVTSVAMDDKSTKKLVEALESKLNKTVSLKNIVDTDVIGGVLLKIENKIIDGTIKGQLQEIEKAMKGA